MGTIRITSTPPSSLAPESICEKWVGVAIPLATEEEIAQQCQRRKVAKEGITGYVVRGVDAIDALRVAGNHNAAAYWSSPTPPEYLEFPRECCQEEDS